MQRCPAISRASIILNMVVWPPEPALGGVVTHPMSKNSLAPGVACSIGAASSPPRLAAEVGSRGRVRRGRGMRGARPERQAAGAGLCELSLPSADQSIRQIHTDQSFASAGS